MRRFIVMPENEKVSWYSSLGLFLLLGGLIAGLFILPFTITGDGSTRYSFMDTLVHQHQITPMRYSMVGPLFSLPLWLISTFFRDPTIVIARYNFFLFAIFLLILYRWLRNWFDQKFLLTSPSSWLLGLCSPGI